MGLNEDVALKIDAFKLKLQEASEKLSRSLLEIKEAIRKLVEAGADPAVILAKVDELDAPIAGLQAAAAEADDIAPPIEGGTES